MLAVDQLIGNPAVTNPVLNGSTQTQLQNNYALEFLHLRLTGTLTNSGYTTAPSKYVESLENFIQALQLTATGNTSGATADQLCNVDASYLAAKTRWMEGTAPTRTDVGTGNAAYAFESNFKRYFIDPRSNSPRLTVLFTNFLSSLMMTTYWRDQTAMVYGGVAGTSALSGVQLTIQARQYLNATPPNPAPYIKETFRSTNVVQQTNGLDMNRVPTGNVLRRQVFKGTVGPVAWADPSNAIFAASGKPEGPHIQLKLNNQVLLLDQTAPQMQADDKTLFGVESWPTGYVAYEPARNKKISASIPMANVANADNYVDVGFTSGSINTLTIYDEELVRLSAAQFKQF